MPLGVSGYHYQRVPTHENEQLPLPEESPPDEEEILPTQTSPPYSEHALSYIEARMYRDIRGQVQIVFDRLRQMDPPLPRLGQLLEDIYDLIRTITFQNEREIKSRVQIGLLFPFLCSLPERELDQLTSLLVNDLDHLNFRCLLEESKWFRIIVSQQESLPSDNDVLKRYAFSLFARRGVWGLGLLLQARHRLQNWNLFLTEDILVYHHLSPFLLQASNIPSPSRMAYLKRTIDTICEVVLDPSTKTLLLQKIISLIDIDLRFAFSRAIRYDIRLYVAYQIPDDATRSQVIREIGPRPESWCVIS